MMFRSFLFAAALVFQPVAATFWRYRVPLQSRSQNENLCPPPNTTVTISVNDFSISEVSGGVTCNILQPASLRCTGSDGYVTLDIQQPTDGSQSRMRVVMDPPEQPFSCSSGVPLATTYGLGILCPNGRNQFMTIINCSPGSAYQAPSTAERVSFCVDSCDTAPCTNDNFSRVNTNILLGGCIWASESEVPVPTSSMPVMQPNPTPAPISAPVAEPPTETCLGFNEECVLSEDCCSQRCFARQCRKSIPENKSSLAVNRGGAAGAAKATIPRNRQRHSIRG